MAKEEKKSVTIVTSEAPRKHVLQLTKDDISTEIDFKLTKQLLKIGVWVISTVGLLLMGTIGGAVWTMNAKVNELSGKFSSPDKLIETVSNRVQLLEDENKQLKEKIHNIELQKLQNEIELLKKTKN